MMMFMMGFWMIVPLLLIGALAYAIGWRPQFNHTGQHHTNQNPVEILNERFARGEITREEYDHIRRDLEG